MSWRKSSLTRASLLLGSLVGSLSCNPDENVMPRPNAPQSNASVGQTFRPRSTSWGPQVLANEHRDFGGAFIDKGVINIYITDAGLRSGAEAPIRASLLRMHRTGPVHVLRGKFSYQQLQEYEAALGRYYRLSGVAYTRIDDWTNQLHIGVVDIETRARLVDGIKRLALDSSAIVLESTDYARLTGTHDLRDQVRPLWGGLQIKVNAPTTTWTGSLGAIVQINGVSYGLTASHLADTAWGGSTGGSVFQNASGPAIGAISVNPAQVPSGCPANHSPCRQTDAALFALTETSIGFGKIARPGPSFTACCSNGTRVFDDTNPILLSSEPVICTTNGTGCFPDLPLPGDSASKIGEGTGWTGGVIIGKQDVQVDSEWILEAILIEGADQGGDSGGPILSNDSKRLLGIAFGTTIHAPTGHSLILGSLFADISEQLTGSKFALHSIPPPNSGNGNTLSSRPTV
jgi:hypothetical protein